MKLWNKGTDIDKKIEKFTVGDDYILDMKLVKYDCTASIAHAKMLSKNGILNKIEYEKLKKGLNEIIMLNKKDKFVIKQSDEDCHTAIENFLTKKYGDVGKKIHTARSRNDQVLTAMRLYEKSELMEIEKLISFYEKALKKVINKYGKIQIPGYTHMQKAMPTTIAMWLGSFIDSNKDNLILLDNVKNLLDKSPLGSAAGFGVPVLKIDKKFTAKEMGFSSVQENPMHCQLSRGKYEAQILAFLSSVMFDLNKLATDLMIFSMAEFGYLKLPKRFCTGSSIMPQKKNPDVLELLRAKYHVVLAEEFKVKSIIGNLMSGYNRDMQLTKEPVMKSIDIAKESLSIITLVLDGLSVDKDKCKNAMSDELYATEDAYKLVKKGKSFRDAYKEIGKKYN